MASRYLDLDQLIQTSLSQPENEIYVSKTILDSVADGVFSVDLERKITSFNRAAEHITGYSRYEVIGRSCADVFGSEVCENSCPVLEAIASEESVVNREFEILDRQKRKVPISVSASVLRDGMGQIVGAVETFRDLTIIAQMQEQVKERYSFRGIYSRNPAMHNLFNVLPDIAASDATVLVQGDSGTGKELFAKALHDLSARRDGPLVIVNCGALPEPLLEAEIFGAKRGAYTGAMENRPGRLEMAQGGTLFLDEIGDLPLALQVKLLRVLENREFQPLGAKHPQKADVRFVTATHRHIETMVEEGSFRRDLFFRINVVGFHIPPLRDRKEDIPLLIDLALNKLNKEYNKKIRGFTPDAMQRLMQHDFPGNIRELLNLVEQTVILCREGEIGQDLLPEYLQEGGGSVTHRQRTRGCPTAEELARALDRFHGNRQLVAQEFGVERTTLWRWMKRLNLT